MQWFCFVLLYILHCRHLQICLVNDPNINTIHAPHRQGRRHGVVWGGHVHPTFARGHPWDWCQSGEFFSGGEGGVCHALELHSPSCTCNHNNLGFGEFAKHGGWRKFGASVGHQNLKGFQLYGAPWPSDQGLCLWTPLGAPPPDPRIGSRSVRSPCVHPTLFDLATPLHTDADFYQL